MSKIEGEREGREGERGERERKGTEGREEIEVEGGMGGED